ncbi:MAG TPA: hypothetical protein VK897_20850 [Anaerolineales bacterium]|nr:hypothetical protein [Anaerolineales bacterium]
MNKATAILSSTLGILAGIMGIEHGIGEVLEGYRPTDSVFILSWPDSAFFEIMSGEPAMTIVPNYLVTGLLAIFFSCVFLVVFVKPSLDRKPNIVLFALLILMLLTGGGFGPPILGIIAVLIALKRNSPLKTWSKLHPKYHSVLSMLWPWSFGLCLLGWLMLFPGAALIVFITGVDNALLMIIPILIAFTFIPVTLLLGFSRDLLRRKSELRDILPETLPQMQ